MRNALIRPLLSTLTIVCLTVALVALSSSFAPSPIARAENADVLTQLLEQARRWQARGRLDKAAEAYQKVLRARPEDPEALEALGTWHASAGRAEQARAHLTVLSRVAAGSPAIARLQAALSVGKQQGQLIASARAQVRAGQLERAVQSYRGAFAGAPPPQHLALEFYQTLGGTEQGWDEAQQGLERLLAEQPGWGEARLALARHLTYRERTRRDGIERLRALVREGILRPQASAAWRQALLWLKASAEDGARLQQYLAEVGDDPQVRARLKTFAHATTVSRGASTTQAGFAALERQDIDEASRQFARAGDAPEALVGLAVVAMRKEDFELAVKLLQTASTRAPSRQELWGPPLASARFWAQVKRAEKLASQDPQSAERLLREAIPLAESEAHHARIALAALLQETGRGALAEQELRISLETQPEQPELLRALTNLLIERDEFEAALELNARLTTLAPERAWAPAQLEAEVLRRRARERHAQGELEAALDLLSEAERLASNSYWIVHDLASLAIELGELTRAREGIDRLLALDPSEPAARVLRARAEAESGHPEAALELLGGLPATAAQGAVGKLREELELQRDLDRVVRGSAQAGTFATRRELLRLSQRFEERPDLGGRIALAWAEVGEAPRAVELLQRLIANQRPPAAGTLLQLAAVYLHAHMDDELRQLLEELASDPSLPTRARRDLAKLHVAFAVGTADRLAATGEYARALLQLESLLVEYPEDAALLSGLGRLFLSAGDPAQASATFVQILRKHPQHLEARDGAVSAALARGEFAQAEELVALGLRAQPRSARMHLIAAHYELARGDDAAGMRALEKAQRLVDSGGVPVSIARDRSTMVASDARGLVLAARAGLASEQLSPTESKALAAQIDREIEAVRGRHAVAVQAEPQLRYRNGETGLGRLTELRLPLSLSIPLGYFGRLEVGADAVYLSSGDARLDKVDVASRFGALGALPAVAPRRTQDDVGIAPRVSFVYRDRLTLELGATPLGFVNTRVIGALGFRLPLGAWAFTLRGERQAVTDSLLSYAGTTDPVSGRTWGGVTAQGGSLDISAATKQLMFYVLGGAYYLTGQRVVDNLTGRISAGLLWTLYDWDGHKVRFGATAFGMAYRHNQMGFTLGHGGYFSPQWFARGGAPISYQYAGERLQAKLVLDPGLNWYRTERSAYYPRSATLQAQREGLSLEASYPTRDDFGFSLNLTGELRYDLTRMFALGAQGSMHFANDYEEYRAGLFARLSFDRRVRGETTTR